MWLWNKLNKLLKPKDDISKARIESIKEQDKEFARILNEEIKRHKKEILENYIKGKHKYVLRSNIKLSEEFYYYFHHILSKLEDSLEEKYKVKINYISLSTYVLENYSSGTYINRTNRLRYEITIYYK